MSITSAIGDRFKAEFTAQVISVVTGAALIIILARILNPDDYGLLFLAISVFGVLELFSKLGVAKSAARYISEYKEKDQSQLRHIIKFSFLLNLLVITIVCSIVFVASDNISYLIGEPDLVPLLSLGALFIAFSTIAKFGRLILQGFEKIEISATLHGLDRGSRFIFVIGFVLMGYGIIGALAGYIFAYILSSTFGLIYIYFKLYRHLKPATIEPGLRRRITEYTVPLTATSTANVLDKRIDTVLVGFFAGPAAVAYYTIGKQIIGFIETPISALGFTLAPMYEAQQIKNGKNKAARIYETALVHGLTLYIPAAAGLILVTEPIVTLIFGTNYNGAIPVIQVLSVYAVFQAISKITSNGLDFLGQARKRAIIKTLTSILNVILNIILIPNIGVVGAAVATVISYPIYSLANIYLIHSELNLRIKYLFKCVVLIGFATAVMSSVTYVLTDYVHNLVTLLLVVGAGAGVWAIIVRALGLVQFKKIISEII